MLNAGIQTFHGIKYAAWFYEKELGAHPIAGTLDGSRRLVTSEESRDED